MPIRRHGKGWEVRVQHAGRRLSRTVGNRRDAIELERRLRQRVSDSRAGRTPAYSLDEALTRWLTGEAKVLQSHANLVNKVRAIYPFQKGRALTEVGDVAEELKSAGIRGGLAVATINRRLAILRRVARLAFRQWGWLERDVSGRIQLLSGEQPRYVQATPEQAEKLLAAAEGRTRAGILWGALTGLRKSELVAVRPEHFRNGELVLTKTKTGRPRIVPLAPGLSAEAFPYGLTAHDLERPFREARKRAGMPWLQFRDLRRTFGSWIVQKHGNLRLAQELLGHSTITITARHYAHMLDEGRRKAMRGMPRLAGQARGRNSAPLSHHHERRRRV